MITGVEGCFKAVSKNTASFSKPNAEYECSLTGGSLVSLETTEKLEAVKTWLKDVKKTSDKYFWLNTAIQRDPSNAFSSNWTWVWLSSQTNSYSNFTYDNWAAGEATNFNGDSVYMKISDGKFYVRAGSQVYYNASNGESVGVMCEAKMNGLASSQINILLKSSNDAYTLQK